MKISVTGATGFIGRHVVQALSRTSAEVVIASRRSSFEFAGLDSVRHVTLDLASPSASSYHLLGSPDVVIHLAWAGLPNYQSLHHFESELPRQFAFLKSLVEAGLPSLVVAGTCYEYGALSGELSESMVCAPTIPYGYAKAALLAQLEFLGKKHPFALTWARLFYMYGERQPATSLYPQLLQAIQRGDSHFPISRGDQLRDFLPVTEVARILVELALKANNAGIVNVCSGEPVSVRGFIEKLLEANRWNIELQLGRRPYPAHEPLAFWGSTKKLHSLVSANAERVVV